MIKTIGLIMILACSMLSGMLYVSRLKERVRLLRSVYSALHSMECRLSVAMPELAELFEQCCDKRAAPIARMIAEGISSGRTAAESIRAAFASPYVVRLLTCDEREYLANMLSEVGECSADGAKGMLIAAESYTAERISEADEYEKQNKKAAMAIAVYAGAAAVIVLM